MIQAPPEPRGLVDEIVATLVSRFNPRRVYLFGSHARGDAQPDSDYDFLIELDRRPEGVTITRQGMTRLDGFPDTEIQVHVRSPGQLERRKDDPGTIDWDVVREGRLLFSVSGLPAINPGPSRKLVREGPGELPNSLDGWIEHAERDMRLATHLSSDFAEWKESICFHAQQAAEKFLKALIISQHERPVRTHKLVDLLGHLRRLRLDLGDLTEEAEFLSPFAVDMRYPEEDKRNSVRQTAWLARPVEVTEAEARRAFAAAQRIEAAVRPLLP